MIWQFLILTQIILLGFFNFFKKKISRRNSYTILFAINFLPAPFLLAMNSGFPAISWEWVFPAFSVLFYGLGGVLDIKALRDGDVSLITPLYTLRNVFVLALSMIILNEQLTIQKFLGVMLVFLGTGFLNKKTNLLESFKSLLKQKPVILTILASMLFSLANVNDKFSLTYFNEYSYAFIIYTGYATFMLPLMILDKGLADLKKLFTKDLRNTVLASFCVGGSYLFFLITALLVDVSVIIPLTNLSVFVSMILGWKVLGEKVESRFGATIIMVLGAGLLVAPQFF